MDANVLQICFQKGKEKGGFPMQKCLPREWQHSTLGMLIFSDFHSHSFWGHFQNRGTAAHISLCFKKEKVWRHDFFKTHIKLNMCNSPQTVLDERKPQPRHFRYTCLGKPNCWLELGSTTPLEPWPRSHPFLARL